MTSPSAPAFVPLSADQRTAFERDGFLHVPGALDAAGVEQLTTAGDRLMRSSRVRDRETLTDGFDSFRNVVALDPAFRGLVVANPALSFVAQLLGPNIHVVSSQLIYLDPAPPLAARRARTPEATGWHRDLYGVARDLGHDAVPRVAIKCAYYLNDLSAGGAGATLFAPGSHRLAGDIPISPGAIDPDNAVELPIRAGDLILFENRTFHAGGVNSSDSTRKAAMIQYGYRWIRPVDYVQQPTAVVRDLPPVHRQLLGVEDRDAAGRIAMGRGSEALEGWLASNRDTGDAARIATV